MPKLSEILGQQPDNKRLKLSDVASTGTAHPDDVPYANGGSPYTMAELMPSAMAPEREHTAGEFVRALGRDAAMQGGALLRGAAALPDVVLAPATGVVNKGLDALGVDPAYHQITAREAISRGLAAAGVPEPATATERFADRAVETLGGLAGGAGLIGRGLAAAEGVPAQAVGRALTDNLGAQTAAATSAATLGHVAHESGLGPRGELTASLVGSLLPAAGGGAYQALESGAARALGRADESTVALAQRANELGIPLKASQLSQSRPGKVIDSVTKNTPFSGGRAFDEGQQEAFNKAVGRTIGLDDVTKIGPDEFDRARRTIGAEFDRLTDSSSLSLNKDLAQKIRDVRDNAASYYGPDAKSMIDAITKRIVDQSQNGKLPGRAFQSIDSNLGRAIAKGGENSVPLGDLQEVLRDAMEASLPAADAAAWSRARAQWRDLKTIEPLVAKEGQVSGNISSAQLIGRVNANKSGKSAMARGDRGDLGDIAAVGQRFVKDSVPNSGTAGRLAVIDAIKSAAPAIGLGAGAAGASPFIGLSNALLTGAGAVGTSRLTQKILQSPELVNAMLGRGNNLTALRRGIATSSQPTLLEIMQSAGN